jgi:N-acetylmuramoyl-L-alanine amidase
MGAGNTDLKQHFQARQIRRGAVPALLAAMAAIGVAAPGRAHGAQLDRIALRADRHTALLTLSLSTPVVQRVFRLHSPERLVIDLPATRRRAPLPQPPADSVVVAMRSGVPDGHTLRLVLELRTALQPRLQPVTRSSSYQLRIALSPSGRARPAVAAGAPAPEAAPAPSDAAEPTATAEPAATPSSAAAPATAARAGRPPEPELATAPARSVRAAHAPRGEHSIIVAVDAGHGGDDPGATGLYGTHEKVVTLAIARALAARIDREPGMHAVLTRDGDYFVELRKRMQRAHAAHADMFVSIHADAVLDRAVSGASVYILSERGASSEAARTLAEQQNAADLKGGISLAQQRPDVRSVVLDVAQSANIGQSVEAADRVLGALDQVGAVRKREVQQAAFVVLKSPDIPSLLVETAYISNAGEERKLRDPDEQRRLAEAIFDGIDAYFRQFPPEGSQYARMHAASADDAAQVARSGL